MLSFYGGKQSSKLEFTSSVRKEKNSPLGNFLPSFPLQSVKKLHLVWRDSVPRVAFSFCVTGHGPGDVRMDPRHFERVTTEFVTAYIPKYRDIELFGMSLWVLFYSTYIDLLLWSDTLSFLLNPCEKTSGFQYCVSKSNFVTTPSSCEHSTCMGMTAGCCELIVILLVDLPEASNFEIVFYNRVWWHRVVGVSCECSVTPPWDRPSKVYDSLATVR